MSKIRKEILNKINDYLKEIKKYKKTIFKNSKKRMLLRNFILYVAPFFCFLTYGNNDAYSSNVEENIAIEEEIVNEIEPTIVEEDNVVSIKPMLEKKEAHKEETEVSTMNLTLLSDRYRQYLEEETMYESYLIEYSDLFHLDSSKIIELAKTTTNNFTDFSKIIHNDIYNLESIESRCLTFVYLVNRNDLTVSLEELGTSKKKLLTTTEPEIFSYDHIDDLRLHDGSTYYDYVSKICDLFGVKDKSMVLAISLSEMDVNDPNNVSRTKNNFCGMMDGNFNLLTLPTPEAGIIAMCGNIKRRYDDYSIEDVKELASHYVLGSPTKANAETKVWIHNVKFFYSKINSNYMYYFSNEEKSHTLALRK